MNITKTMVTAILATAVSFSVLAETANQPNAAASNVPAEQAAPAAAVPIATEPQQNETTMPGFPQGRMKMMHEHMQKMEALLTNIESLLKQLVEQKKP